MSITIDLRADQSLDTLLATLPPIPSLTDSVTHVMCSPRMFGLHTDCTSSITIRGDPSSPTQMVDSGSNLCITGNLSGLLDVVDIESTTISVALEGAPASYNDCITKRGLLPLSLSDDTTYYQTCFYFANMVETIILPAAVLASSDVFCSWTQEGFKDPALPGSLRFTSHDGLVLMYFPLHCREDLYYCNTDIYTVDRDPVRVLCNRTTIRRPNPKFHPRNKARKIELEVWALRFGSPGEHQLDLLPSHVDGTPPRFKYHPFCHINFKEQAYVRKQPAEKKAACIPGCGSEFFMDFGFLWVSSDDHKQPNNALDRVVTSYDGYCTYLLIVDSLPLSLGLSHCFERTPPCNTPCLPA
jgi:hypothetical protein